MFLFTPRCGAADDAAERGVLTARGVLGGLVDRTTDSPRWFIIWKLDELSPGDKSSNVCNVCCAAGIRLGGGGIPLLSLFNDMSKISVLRDCPLAPLIEDIVLLYG